MIEKRQKRANELYDWAVKENHSKRDLAKIHDEARHRWSLTCCEANEVSNIVVEMLDYLEYQNKVIRDTIQEKMR